ncbi:hypothetical protein ASG52_18495 [Methylobacterium sp. Leaf456]|uniref:hypothetical protein n=1 Tax=Methylobacterium sp. Leaf456 TaxID=1736382 RepID=UPI0006F7D463|nr:hypothetical protein [Methylobacterium sp. Leaf456]KQT60112.1 hypothetical protein ASG52_18495 [Methylobacterium sp. Leaf456]
MRACLLDTNLLVLLTVGRASPAFVEVHKRTRSDRSEDMPLLETLLAKADRIVTTPHVLGETSNLIRQFQEPGRGRTSKPSGILPSGQRKFTELGNKLT